jgi:hypothetical protein
VGVTTVELSMGIRVSKPLREAGEGEAMERGNNPSTVPRTLPSLQHNRSEIITTHQLLELEQAVGPGRLICIDAAQIPHQRDQVDEMAELSGYKVATRRGISLLLLARKDAAPRHASY